MNYVRGAFSAVTSYYTSLPPINASTLTGAIDVIVVERRNADTGETEFACSPFHVRLGKWQVLRPGEKLVSVLVNGKAIPYSMKIGDAGEAFFVFETDEDVPEELMTSPILGPTKVQDETSSPKETEAHRQNATAGRFGASDGPANPPPAGPDDDKSPSGSSSATDQRMTEPTFLDLDGSAPQTPTGNSTPSGSPIAENPPHTSDNANASSNDTSRPSPTSTPTSILDVTKNVLTAGPLLVKSVITNAPHTAVDSAKQARDRAHNIKEGLLRREHEEESSDRPLADETDAAAQAPDIRYGHDVVLDMAGYHNAEAVVDEDSREGTPENLEATETASAPRLSADNLASDTQVSSTTSSNPGPSSSKPFPLSSSATGNFIRGGSAPPDLELSTSPPDYTWDWGGFPTPSPARRSFTQLAKDDTAMVGPSHLSNVVASAEDDEDEMFGQGGTLGPDEKDDKLFWVTMAEGKTFSFELSLCGGDGADDKKRRDDVESATWFEDRKIQYERLFKDPEVADRSELVMKWNGQFITRKDDSPLLQALLHWRRTMRAPADPRHRPIPSSVSDPELSSPPTSPGLPPAKHQRVTSTSWARWWSRTRDREDSASTIRPTMPPPTNSAPPKLDMDNSESPLMEPTKPGTAPAPAPASVALPASRNSSPPPEQRKNYVKTLRLTSEQLKVLELKKGANTITFSLSATGIVACTAKVFLWDEGDHVVVSDIDGTITKSDALGHMFNLIGRDWTHLGVAKLYTDIARNGYKMMYLTSRAIGQADSTRDYLKGIKQNNYQLPEGPVIMSPDRLMASLHREVIMRKPEVFKMACLRDIQRLFGPQTQTPFYAGFGNRITDALSYRSVSVPSARIFTIDSAGEVKMELLELAGYKSSYIHMTDLVDQMFPPVHRKWAPEYTDFNYWRDPIPEFDLPDLGPPSSPALSAVSDTSAASRFSRIRNFSLRSTGSPANIVDAATVGGRLRKETSPSPLVRSILSSDDNRSTTLADSDEERHHRQHRRKMSFDSMPGSLPGSEYGSDDEQEDHSGGEEEGDEYDEDVEEEEEPPVFDDDFLNEVEHVRAVE